MTQPPDDQQPKPDEPTYPAYPTYPGATPDGGYPPPPAYGSPQHNPYGGWPPPQGFPVQQSGFASWIERVGAFILDSLPGIAISFIATAIFGEPIRVIENGDTVSFETSGSAIVAVYGLGLLWGIFNFIYLQGKTGQTIGKMALGIAVYRAGTTQPIGFGLAIGRYFARFLDVIPCYLGLLWPLWDNEKRTFADMICGTRVYKIR
ncbi:RDD family protein [Aeromicrobium panaciterrae]|uniref:RDD family protein n=1 Tax=Aeromicrobium panaciterrae TaxID=363861 RepID=UPI0031E471C0